MMPFRAKGSLTYKMRIRLSDGRAATLSCGSRDENTARDVERMVAHLRERREWAPLEAAVTKVVGLAELYDAYCHGLVQQLLERAAEAASDIDLEPLVAKWGGRGRRSVSAKYVIQLRRLIPVGTPFLLSRFHRGTISAHLEGLPVSDPTRNRHKAAISQFAKWLVAHRHLEANPVRDCTTFSERAPRMTHLGVEQAKQLIGALAGDARIAAALMCGTGMEWGAIAATRRSDVDLTAHTIHAHGGKTRHRDRIVRVSEDWCWAIIRPHLAGMLPGAPLVRATERQVLDEQRAACERLKLPPQRLHDWRHTYAVTALKRGDAPQLVKRQLGHAPNSALLWTTYGAYIPEITPTAATNPATTRRKQVK